MVGLSDIPCIGKLVDRISDATVDAIFRGFRYMFCYKDLVKTLDSQVEKASTEEERVSTEVAAERANGKLIKPHVDKWQKEAKEIKEGAEKFAEKYKNRQSWRCIQCLPIPNPVSRFRLGREAVQKTERLAELINSGKELLVNEIAHLAPAENLPKSKTEFQDFQSRKDAYAELWRAFITDSSPILGIYGMPGVGKTRMMEQLWKEAHEKNIFNKVTRANVGNEKLDVIHLQNQIAGHLHCNFVSENNAESRASQLKQSLLNAGKTLVILDDVWREIPLDVIGIPCGDGNSPMGSKILFTSREKDACLHNNCRTPVKITPLSNDEAWDQFSKVVGTAPINSLQDESLTKKVCKKCKGLPLLIHAVGKALKFKPLSSWVDALKQLEKGNFENISGIDPEVYACVKLSIDQLPDDAKSCLFLCCLFPEDADISIRYLIWIATGSQLVSDGEDRVLSMVDTLRSSSLLLDDSIKLHDVIRDVGRSIAFKDPKFAFSQVTCGVRLLDDADFVTTKFLRLDLDGDNIHIPGDLVCPGLHSLWIECNNDIQQFSGGFFSMSANLRFLCVAGRESYSYSKLQFSLQTLGKLRTLILAYCDLSHINNTNAGFFPENLETLRILDGDFPKPLDLSNLKYLRKLEINGKELKMIPNTISSLSKLEELHIPSGFEIWRDDSSAVVKPILVEINKLTHLKSLQITFERSESFQDTNIFDNLTSFNICVGLLYYKGEHLCYKTSIKLQGGDLESLKSLVERAEYVKLKDTDINVSSIFDSNREAFTELRELHIEGCHEMEHLARMSQGEIEHSQQTPFSKLTCLKIKRCWGLRYLFCNSVAKCLTQLQKLMIKECPLMEAIVMDDGSSNRDIISFSQLKELELSEVPRLRRFHRENKEAMMQPFAQFLPPLDRMVEFPNLVKLEISSCEEINLESIEFTSELKSLIIRCDKEIKLPSTWQSRLHNLETLILDSCWWHELKSLQFPRLKDLRVRRYSGGSALFTFSGFRSLQQLQELEISDCGFLEEIAEDDEMSRMNNKTVMLSHLEIVFLRDLPKLKSLIQSANYGCCVPSLREVFVDNCGLSTLFSFSEFTRLRSLNISSCALLEEIVEDIRSDEVSGVNKKTITLSQLESVKLKDLPKLKSFIYSANHECLLLPNLSDVSVSNCGLSSLFMCSASGSLQSLRNLFVQDCRMLEGIFEYARGDEASGTSEHIITLSKLERLELIYLPTLKSFIHGANYDCYMPALCNMKVDNCGFSSLFTCSVFKNLQILWFLKVSNCRLLEDIVEDARGDETSESNDKTITLPRLQHFQLKHLPNLKSFSRDKSYAFNMPALRCMQVDNCGFSTLFTCSVFRNILELEYLIISNCGLLEVIVGDARRDETSGTNDKTIILPELRRIDLKDLPNLKSFSRDESYAFNWPALEYVRVDNCGFSTLFTCSVLRNLLKLERLEVSKCRLLEVIVEDSRGDETSDTNDKTVTLPLLWDIKLEHLPKLKSFSRDESCAFNMLKLEYFSLVGCPGVQNFTCLNTNTRRGEVKTDGDEWKEVPDLNDYIKRLFKEEAVTVPEMKRLVGP